MKSQHFFMYFFYLYFFPEKGHKRRASHGILLYHVASLQIHAILDVRPDNQLRILRLPSHYFVGIQECRKGPFGY